MTEKPLTSISGYIALLVGLLRLIVGPILFVAMLVYTSFWLGALAVIFFIGGIIILVGLSVVNPNEAIVTTFFGDYIGTMK